MKKKISRLRALISVVFRTTRHVLAPRKFEPRDHNRHIATGYWFNIWVLVAYRWISGRFIKAARTKNDALVVTIAGISSPLYVEPGSLRELRGVACELYCPSHWHFYEIAETKVANSDVLFDCGSAEGLFSLQASQVARHVYAIEPNPQSVRLLEKTFQDCPNVTVLPVGVGARKEIVHFHIANIHSKIVSADERANDSIEVELTTIDELCSTISGLSYLKADLEGYELSMLKGAAETLFSLRPRLAITCYHYENDPRELVHYVRSVQPAYKVTTKGVDYKRNGPVMLHFYI